MATTRRQMAEKLGIPLRFLWEAMGCVIVVETLNHAKYRGTLIDVGDNMNLTLKNAEYITRIQAKTLDMVLIRGSKILFIQFDPALSESIIFKQFQSKDTKIRI